MQVKFLDVASINRRYRRQFSDALSDTLEDGQFILGSGVEKFEQQFSRYTGLKYTVGVGNGLDALTILLRSVGIGHGDEVIVASNTYIATWLAISNVSAIPIPVEPDEMFNLDPSRVEEKITSQTKAILVTHLYGRLANMEELARLSEKYKLFLFEDAAQAHGARESYGQAGSLSHGAAYSFYPGKNLGAIGDGGAVTTNHREIYTKAVALRNYGSSTKYYNHTKGMNSRLDEFQARVLSIKLQDLDKDNKHRNEIASIYYNELKQIPQIKLPKPSLSGEHVWHLYTILTKQRDDLRDYLALNAIETLIHYPIPPHAQDAYAEFNHLDFPISEEIHMTTLSLPISPVLSHNEAMYVCNCIKAYFE
jgi:dTDP-4-amino-4,6-dideoxygalactose transaminase